MRGSWWLAGAVGSTAGARGHANDRTLRVRVRSPDGTGRMRGVDSGFGL